MKAGDILELLRQKHTDDVFVDECKNGPTHYTEHVRLDAWAMARSWSKPKLTGYETKVSRSDWLKDQKLHAYMELCNLLFVVAPQGVVLDGELPDGVGLLVVNSKCSGLLTKRKAVYREIAEPADLFRYLLMCRTKVVREYSFDAREKFRAYVEGRGDGFSIGSQVSKKLRAETVEKVSVAKARAEAAELELSRMKDLRTALDRMGFVGCVPSEWTVKRHIVNTDEDREQMLRNIHEATRSLERMRVTLEAERKEAEAKIA